MTRHKRDPGTREYVYRGWKIQAFSGTETGHKLSGSRSTLAQVGIGTHRKIAGYLIHYPEGGTKHVKTMKAAREYIDAYMGS